MLSHVAHRSKIFTTNIAVVGLGCMFQSLVGLQFMFFFELHGTLRTREGSQASVIPSQMTVIGLLGLLLATLLGTQGQQSLSPALLPTEVVLDIVLQVLVRDVPLFFSLL